ncbi:hydroxyethylthiazole kinase [Actibacterium sp. 188UL27-1]|uniref:hydroxyethylthiazole kinase n=1 Tax=Actibacterium sp. 188UL27-1 TaxID=2786961 RepID=UPI00195DAAC8|nr:hydroxyethylthiazole kinase [Actibacterium sp. 188UL27-1]MBM7068548.1 hydroxyethylthiazole kinase [Actibacterium sp. 188UL27-1]
MHQTADILTRMRAQPPLVQCVTNFVAMNFAANTLLAAGGAPAMVHAAEESGNFVAHAGALTINIGTLSPDWRRGMVTAARAANDTGTPWVLDPVAHFATPYRSAAAQELLTLGPTILRGNASEILALAGQTSAGRGVDAGDTVSAAEGAARSLAQTHKMIVAVTGATDYVTDGARSARITGGDPMMAQITATGCALTCLIGATAAIALPFEATVTALAIFAEAGAIAAPKAQGPGSFAMHFLDALATVDPATLPARVIPA